jgi:hypothetical protein
MSLVVLQPCAAAISKKHYEDTIKSPVHLEKVAGLLEPSDVDRLSALYPSGKIPLWGAKPGENNQHVAKWQRMRPGDIILFAKNNEFFTLGVITYLLRSSAAATQLWGTAETANGITQTWECMFAIDELRTISIPVTEINRVVDRKPNANVQEFQVLPQDKSDAVLEYLDMVGNAYAPVPDEPAYENDIEDPDFAQMEFMVEAVRRAEQAFLRKSLFPGDTAHCAICNREFPVRFLVAGHIKRRAACTDAQKRDYFNVVMPNCTFGCDSLFGRGLISVDDTGHFQVSPMLHYGDAAGQYLQDFVAGRACQLWMQNPATRPYFDFHYKTDFKNAVLEHESATV